MSDGTIETTRELCDDIDNLLELAKRSRAPMRAVTLIELARADLQARLDELETAAWTGSS
jgi:hypothetical protein